MPGTFHSLKLSIRHFGLYLLAANKEYEKNVLKSCLNVFPSNYEIYLKHREDCISFREELIKEKGRNYVKFLENDESKILSANFNDQSSCKLSITFFPR